MTQEFNEGMACGISRDKGLELFRTYARQFAGASADLVPSFCRDFPDATDTLAAFFDEANPGWNKITVRMLTRRANKARWAVEVLQSCGEHSGRSHVRSKRSRLLAGVAAVVLALPVLLCPTHPVAVYAYLLERFVPAIIVPAYARSDSGLAEFLLSPGQIDRYRTDLPLDMQDAQSGHMFVIAAWDGLPPTQEPIRTWNSFLPTATPETLKHWLDRKELPFLGDEVDLWLRGATIVARGHYHAFGGGPSHGDQLAQSLLEIPEVVVANGLVPMVYLNGQLVSCGAEVKVDAKVYRRMRALEKSITMEVREIPLITNEPSDGLKYFLAYLRDCRAVDITDLDAIAGEVLRLYDTFQSDHAAGLSGVSSPYLQTTDWDKLNMLRNLESVQSWAEYQRSPHPDL